MIRLHMIEARYTSEGIFYMATEQASLFVQLLRSPYGKQLKGTCPLADRLCHE